MVRNPEDRFSRVAAHLMIDIPYLLLVYLGSCFISNLFIPIYELASVPKQLRISLFESFKHGGHTIKVILHLRTFQKFRLRKVFICAQKCISFAHSFSVTFARMFFRLFLGHPLVYLSYQGTINIISALLTCSPTCRWRRSNRFTQSL